jgi:hypothetical protein
VTLIRDRVTTSGGNRRVLLLSYHFPPGTSAGSLRWQKMLRYGSELGWECDVITLHPDDVSQPDESRLADLPGSTRVIGVRQPRLAVERLEYGVWRVYRVAADRLKPAVPGPAGAAVADRIPTETAAMRKASYSRKELEAERWGLRRVHASYSARVEHAKELAWARAAARAGARLSGQSYAAVVSCGPPHMVHVAAGQLARSIGAPHVVDMRDPWSLVERLPSALASLAWFSIAERQERRVVPAAALVVTNTAAHETALRMAYPGTSHRIMTVMNGFDDSISIEPAHGSRFRIAYTGTIYLDRDPSTLFRAAATVIRDLDLTPEDFSIELMGHVRTHDGVSTDALAAAEGVGGYLHIHPPRRHAEMMHFLAGAALLVSLPQDSEMAIPSKIFDYMQVPSRILALARDESATGQLLRGSNALVVAPDDLEGLVRVIRNEFLKYAGGVRPTRPALDARYSRREQAVRLFRRLDQITDSAGQVR